MKPILGYEGLYAVCESGRIWAYPKYRLKKGRYLNPWLTGRGYEVVTVYKDKVPKKFLVHRLIAQSFVKNPDALPEVNHKDGNRLNNRPENLEWVTSAENKRHAWANGLYTHKGENHHLSTLTEKEVREIIQLSYKGIHSQRDIAQMYGVSQMTISNILSGKTWGHIL